MIRMFVAMLMMFVLFGGLHYYISRRVYQGLVCVFQKLRFGVVLAIFMILMIGMMLGFARSMLPIPTQIKQSLGVVGSYWMGMFVYLLIFTVLGDLLRLVFWMCRLSFAKTKEFRFILCVATIILSFATVVYGIQHARRIQHVFYEVKVEGKEDISDMSIVLISDLHLGAVGMEARLENIVEEINGLHPDLVCISGDFFDSDFDAIVNPEKAREVLSGIKSTYGIYACLGNHDTGKTGGEMLDFLKQCGIRVLNDEYVVIDERLILVGRLDLSPIGGYDGMARKELSEYFAREDDNLPVIIMDHNPASVDSYTDEADLIVSGHTHMGQMFPGSLFTNRMYTVDHGYYQKDENSPHVIVTSGVGTWGMPMRVGTDSEIISIRVIP